MKQHSREISFFDYFEDFSHTFKEIFWSICSITSVADSKLGQDKNVIHLV